MRRMLLGIAIGLLTFASSAWAEGPIVRWDQVLGIVGFTSTSPMVAGSWPGYWYTVRDGRVMLDLETGAVSIRIRGLSRAVHHGNTDRLLGSTTAGTAQGVIVCNSSGRYGSPTMVRTDEFVFDNGDGAYHGILELTQDCRQNPGDLVFLLQLKRGDGTYEPYHAYGADRRIE